MKKLMAFCDLTYVGKGMSSNAFPYAVGIIASHLKKKFEDDLVEKITQHNPSLICLAGFMKILSKDFVDKFKGKIINIHPSLLPKHKGLNTHEKAINSGDKYGGCTVHHVNARVDDGEIIAQQKVIITSDDTADTLKQKVLELEHKLYPKIIRGLLS